MSDNGWGFCPVCGQERKLSGGVLIWHRRYSKKTREMVSCEGSHTSPRIIVVET